MENEEALVGHLIAVAGGEIVGRVRLQKVFYLLDQLGLNSGFSYSYHHYGPYSADVADAVDGAKAFKYVREETRNRQSDGVPFSVFEVGTRPVEEAEDFGDLSADDVRRLTDIMNASSSTVLELAATIHWLKNEPGVDDWRAELVVRKGQKTENGRTEKAVQLLEQLAL